MDPLVLELFAVQAVKFGDFTLKSGKCPLIIFAVYCGGNVFLCALQASAVPFTLISA